MQKAVAAQLLEEAQISVKALMTPCFPIERQYAIDENSTLEPKPPQEENEKEKVEETDDRLVITDSNPGLNTFCFFLEKIFLHGFKGTCR